MGASWPKQLQPGEPTWSTLKWTLESRQKSTEFRLHIQLHSQLDGAAPVLVFLRFFPKSDVKSSKCSFFTCSGRPFEKVGLSLDAHPEDRAMLESNPSAEVGG
jgi:hypothetical protein